MGVELLYFLLSRPQLPHPTLVPAGVRYPPEGGAPLWKFLKHLFSLCAAHRPCSALATVSCFLFSSFFPFLFWVASI